MLVVERFGCLFFFCFVLSDDFFWSFIVLSCLFIFLLILLLLLLLPCSVVVKLRNACNLLLALLNFLISMLVCGYMFPTFLSSFLT